MQSLIESGGLPQVLGVLIGLCSVLMPVAIVFIVLYFRHRRSIETLATVRYLADKGLPVPADLLRAGKGERAGSDPRSMLVTSLLREMQSWSEESQSRCRRTPRLDRPPDHPVRRHHLGADPGDRLHRRLFPRLPRPQRDDAGTGAG